VAEQQASGGSGGGKPGQCDQQRIGLREAGREHGAGEDAEAFIA
jgi:hypothetical protein